jgi:D-sedoheptulose 7-phosphate isomerase/D-glycero-D-manno-heptose 1,7-bisphosphate phosphatase
LSTQVAQRADLAVDDATANGRPGVLLDRDGTIIADHGYVGSLDRVEMIEGAAQAIALFNRASIPVAVITNQSGIARGLYDVEDVEKVHAFISDRLALHGACVDMYLFCPYHPDGIVDEYARASVDRKPAPGMAQKAAEALHLDLGSSWVVGDRPEDIGVGQAIGASVAYLGPDQPSTPGVYRFPSLAAAAPFILERIDS